MPKEAAGLPSVDVVVMRNGSPTPAATVSVVSTAPAIFITTGNGGGKSQIYNADNSANSIRNPASKGSLVKFTVTGIGLTDPPGTNGEVSPPGVAIQPVAPAYLLIGGKRAAITQITSLQDYAGVYQVQAAIPADAPTASDVPVIFAAGMVLSSPATIAVQ